MYTVYTPNREKLFEDIDVGDECDTVSCPSYRQIKNELVCKASAHGECVRVNQLASEINQFISDNDDVFMYVTPVRE